VNENRPHPSSLATGLVSACLLAVVVLSVALALVGCGSERSKGEKWVIAPHWIDVPPTNLPRNADCSYRDCRSTYVSDVIAAGPGLVAVGGNGFGEITADGGYLERQSAGVWTSKDGLTWKGVRNSGSGFAGATMSSVAKAGQELVAVGYDGSGAAAWISETGSGWTRVGGKLSALRYSAMNSITAGGPGFVAVGQEGSKAVVWTSTRGRSWNRVAVFGASGMAAVTAAGPGLVAVGSDKSGAAVWLSKDGRSWTRVRDPLAEFGGAEMSTVVAGETGLVAAGSLSDPYQAAVWTSRDGLRWTRVHSSTLDMASISDVIAGGPGLVAVGDAVTDPLENPGDRAGDTTYATVWTSGDGFVWKRRSTKHYGGMAAVTTFGRKLVAVGLEPGGEQGTGFAAAWVSNR
jgi:hypothetical protein